MNYIKNAMGLGIIIFLLCSCSNELTIVMPKGPAGASAYEVWVQAVKDGTVDWDADRTDLANFFLYLKGQDGKDGQNDTNGINGTNGTNGLSAYDLWVQEVQNGNVMDPRNPDQLWSKSETSIQDFWYYLAGAPGQDGVNGTNGTNGQSAYDLWVQEVLTGNLDDPHNPGQKWPTDHISTQDFWDFLTGPAGASGETTQPGGETGQPGEDIPIVPGKPNVIAQYVNQNYNEFVRWEDGAVGYIVYDDTGVPASGAQVTGLPGVKDPNKVYTANPTGFFLVPKEDLPDNLPVANRRGTALVNGITSAPNTYVPNRMYVRMTLESDPVIDGTYIKFSPLVERQTDGKDWEVIPTYLGDLNEPVYAYELTDPTDPTSFTPDSATYSTAESTVNISSHTITLRINRLRKAATYYSPIDEWDGNPHYFTLALNSYYGQLPQTAAVIKMAPIQAMPMIKNVSASNYNPTGEFFAAIQGEMDINVTDFDYNLFFKNTLDKTTSGSITYYSPVIEDPKLVDNSQQFTVGFNRTGNNANNNSSRASILNPSFTIGTPYIEASVVLTCTTSYFYPLNTIGYLRFGTAGDLNTLTIVKRTANPDGWRYNFSDMPVQYFP